MWCVHCVSWTDFVEVFARNWRSLEAKNGEIWLFSQLSFGLKYRYGKWYFILFLVPLRTKVFLLGVLKMIIITSSLLHINKAFQNEHVKIYSYPKSKEVFSIFWRGAWIEEIKYSNLTEMYVMIIAIKIRLCHSLCGTTLTTNFGSKSIQVKPSVVHEACKRNVW